MSKGDCDIYFLPLKVIRDLEWALLSKMFLFADRVNSLFMRPFLSKVRMIDLIVEYFLSINLDISPAGRRCALCRCSICSLSSKESTWFYSCSRTNLSFFILILCCDSGISACFLKSASENSMSTRGKKPALESLKCRSQPLPGCTE